jgi:MFS family permease
MRPLGGAIFGIYGDKLGRKKAMVITIMGFSIATFSIGLLPTFVTIGILAPILLIVVRLVQGIFAGGEWGSGAVITMETVPKQKRGLYSGFLQSGFSFGFLLASIMFQIVTINFVGDAFDQWGWRVLFFTGIVPGLVALFVRLKMDESSLWTAAKETKLIERSPLKKMLSDKKHRSAFFLCAFMMTGMVYMYHGSISILPTYLHQFGHFERVDIAGIMIYATIFSWIGMIFTGWLSQKIGRKRSILYFTIGGIVIAIPTAFGILTGNFLTILFVIPYAFVVSTASGPVPALFSESFPTELRNSAAGFSYNAGLIFGSWSPLVSLSFMQLMPQDLVPLALGLNIIIGAIIIIIPTILSRETKENELK